jgi:aminoglycoside 6'-N-acetyltransferase
VDVLSGEQVTLRPLTESDLPALREALATPEVAAWWGGWDPATALRDEAVVYLSVVAGPDPGGEVVGMVQWEEEREPDYRHAGMDLFLHPGVHGRGFGADAVRTLARWLFEVRGHHRLVIDPAVGNEAAIACYRRVGFSPVGVMRRYERGPDGKWRDGLLMDLLAEDLALVAGPGRG